MTAAVITLAILLALGWLEVLSGWGVIFPSQRPAKALRIATLAALAGGTAWIAWYCSRFF